MSATIVEIIKKTRAQESLSKEEISFLVEGFIRDEVPEYQMSAWLMSVFFQGLTSKEAAHLTEVMLHSGHVLDFSELPAKKVDKHSTGGVGDKTSLILAPIVACAGLYVPMISGRGLGHTGGTLDKLESIPGFTTSIDESRFREILSNLGSSLIGQTKDICPADKRIYALRDVTATVESIPLICASIMSKKLAEGIDALVLDVKFGSGAFMKTLKEAEVLATSLIEIGRHHGKQVAALLTSMEQPLGRFIGNSLEVEECLAILKGESLYGVELKDLQDTIELSLELSGHMLWLGSASASPEEGYQKAKEILESGAAYEKFLEIARAQGGDVSQLPKAKVRHDICAKSDGFMQSFDTEKIGMTSILLGAGRKKQTDLIDPVAGIQIHHKIGDAVQKGAPLFTLFSSQDTAFEEAEIRLRSAAEISLQKPPVPVLIRNKILPPAKG